jgi:hypothetical protein
MDSEKATGFNVDGTRTCFQDGTLALGLWQEGCNVVSLVVMSCTCTHAVNSALLPLFSFVSVWRRVFRSLYYTTDYLYVVVRKGLVRTLSFYVLNAQYSTSAKVGLPRLFSEFRSGSTPTNNHPQ